MNIETEGNTSGKTCVVVNEDDKVQYIGQLAECHTQPMVLHRAFSLFVCDKEGRLLLQQRAKSKYTFPLSWTNTVCSHPRNLDKSMGEWIDIRIQDELGWNIRDIRNRLVTVGKLTYEAFSDFKYGEKEIDTLYVLEVDDEEKAGIQLNLDEVEAIDWVDADRLPSMMLDDTILLTPWFRAIVANVGHPFIKNLKSTGKPIGEAGSPDDFDKMGFPWYRVGNVSMPQANKSSDYLLQGPFSYICSNPGKALRSTLVKLYTEFDTNLSSKDAGIISSVVERIHAASLLHDDIEDRSSSRRGAVCAHLLWGTAQTLNTGTFNFLRAIQDIDRLMDHYPVETRHKLMQSVTETLLELHRGQNADVFWADHAMCPTLDEYVEMIDHKTGVLFQACAELGGICTGNTEISAKVSSAYQQLGRFFQIRDDYCNICDEKYWQGKGFYEDADEGKYSYPVLVLLRKDSSSENACWLRTKLADRAAPMTIDEKQRAYKILYESGALEETRQYCLARSAELRPVLGENSKIAQKILATLSMPDIKSPEEVKAWIAKHHSK